MRVITSPDCFKSGNQNNEISWQCCKTSLKTFITPLFFLAIFLSFSTVRSQTTVPLEDRVVAGFGVDGDVYNDVNEIVEPPVIGNFVGSDDWFLAEPDGNPTPGAGVIEDDIDPALKASLLAGDNIFAEIRMSADIYTEPEGDGILWIDAVFFRDQRTNGSNKDATIFDQAVNKNFDNPTRWRFKIGSVPQKNDIIDIFGHLRRNPEDSPGGDDEFAIVGASTRSDNGDSYLDFEYYREDISLNEDGTALISDGMDCGHTAYEFDLPGDSNVGDDEGEVITHGDVILSFNYLGGGKNIDVRLFVWIDKRDFPTNADFEAFNNLPDRPFNFGNQTGGFPFFYCDNDPDQHFGYAQIRRRPDEVDQGRALFAQVNTGGTPNAPPWGTINEGGDVSDVYTQFTFAELAINATIFGFDTRSTGGECQSPLGSVLVKSRSSASFDSSLKDAGGPFDLGNTPEVTVAVADGEYECFEDSATLTAVTTPAPSATRTFSYKWYVQIGGEGEYVLIEGEEESTYDGAVEGNLYKVEATISINGTPGCTATDTDIAVVQKNPASELNAICPDNVTLPECSSVEDINSAFNTWKTGLSYEGGGGEVTPVYTVNGETVENFDDLIAPDACGGEVTIGISVTDECEQEDSCTTTFTVTPDETDPEIADIPDYTLEGCNADWPEFLSTTWTDNCADGGEINSDGGGDITTSEDGCSQSRVYTFEVEDDCGNTDTESTIVTREYDATDPEIADIPDYTLEGCNAEWPPFLTTEWTDNCAEGGEINSDGGGDVTTSEDGCSQSRVYTFEVEDDCGNTDTESTTVTREFDETDPEIADIPDYTLEGCNAEWPPFLTTEWTDNCAEGGQINSDGGGDVTTSEDGCSQSRVYTFEVEDDCGNTDIESTTVTREYDETDPEILDVPDYSLEGCNTDWPPYLTTTWTDNCAEGGQINSDGGGDVTTSEDGCSQSRVYTFEVEDDCGNTDTETTTVTREIDETDPVIIPPTIEDTCNDYPPEILTATWTDNCAEGGTVDANRELVGSDECSETYQYTFEVEDDCGNTDEETITVVRRTDVFNCETAYGYPRSGGTVSCFLNDGFSNWGWTTELTAEGEYIFDLYAGNSSCTPMASNIVGYAEVDYLGGEITVNYFITDPAFEFSEVHVWIGETKYPLNNGTETTAPGQYNFGSGSASGTSGTVGPIDVSGCSEVHIIVHAVTCEYICACSDTNGNGGGSFGTIGADGVACDGASATDFSSVSVTSSGFESLSSGFSVAPVPFKETVNIKYDFDYTSNVQIQFFDLNGSLLRTYADKQVSGGDETQINIDFALRSNKVYIVRVQTDRDSFSKSIMSGN